MRQLDKSKKNEISVVNYFTVANFFTVSNLVVGFFAIVFLFLPMADKYLFSTIFILISALCDFLDGYTARKRNETSDFGKQLDSIVDMSSFGVVPAIIFISSHIENIDFFLVFCGAFYVSSGAVRLARFNVIDTDDGKIKGLPITVAAAIFAIKNIIDHIFMRGVSPMEDGMVLFMLSILMLGNFTLKKIGFNKED